MSAPKLVDVTPFEPLIIKVHYDRFDMEKLKPICDDMIANVAKKANLEINDAHSSVYNLKNQPHINQAFSDFYSFLNPIASHILINEWGLMKNFGYSIGNSWVNVHKKGGETLEHHHGPAVLVAATYLQIEEGMGYIEFKDPLEYQKGFHTKENSGTEWKRISAKTGDTFLFPGWIRHRTEENSLNKERWVLTTNYMSTNKLEKKLTQ